MQSRQMQSVGYFREPPVSRGAGEVVEVASEGLVRLGNPVATIGGDR